MQIKLFSNHFYLSHWILRITAANHIASGQALARPTAHRHSGTRLHTQTTRQSLTSRFRDSGSAYVG